MTGTYEQKLEQRVKALEIRRSLGMRRAAAYLRNQGWSLEGARAYLLRP